MTGGLLEERTVVVTGAASGIGAAVLAAVQVEGGHGIGLDLAGSDHDLDVTDEAGWARFAELLRNNGTPLHGLVCAAGVTWRARVGEVRADDARRVLDVNTVGPLLALQALSPLMTAGGSIVMVGSLAALTGHYPAAYTASKWALRGLARTAATELGPAGIRVNTVHPGFIDTPMTAGAPPAFRQASLALAPLGRAGTGAEVADVVTFLLSDRAGYVTGVDLPVDGGAAGHGGAKFISDALTAAGEAMTHQHFDPETP